MIYLVSLCLVLSALEIGGVAITKSGDRSRKCTWLCPCVICPTLPEDCQNSETFIFEQSYFDQNGRTVEIRCESCSYCVDLPANLNKRSDEGVDHIDNTSLTGLSSCGMEKCLELPKDCHNSRPTDVYVKGQKCGVCPACYDHTPLSQIV